MSRSIALVGMGCRFAGADDLQQYWQMIRDGRDGFGPVPSDRWAHDAFFDSNPRARDKSYTPNGGFIDDIRSFPAIALGIPPRRVEVMDPQQRFALEVSLQAVQDAGMRVEDLPKRTGVYVGVTATEYRTLTLSRVTAQLMASGALGASPEDADVIAQAVERVVPPRPFSAAGVLANMIAATVAQELRVKGPAFTSDAACASAMIAIAQAADALRAGRIDAALAGGVYVCVTPEHHVAFSRIGAISKSGRCLPFDARADGFVQGDGAGVLLLKRLEDAQRDGDRIYATLDGIALNNDGGGEGPMAPVQSGQVDCIRLAWDETETDPANLGYVETHGTGTQVGDRIEFGGLVEALGPGGQAALGSSKANVGHTMSAAAVAGVIRAALAIHHRTIPPMAGFEAPKEDLGLSDSRFYVPTEARPWSGPRVAAVSSFGFGGTNGHAVLSAAPQPGPSRDEARPQLVLLSAPTAEALAALADRTAAAVEADPACTVGGVALAWARRPAQAHRLCVVATTREELVTRLRERGKDTAVGEALEKPRVAFLYPGQGSQRIGMLADARARFDALDRTLTSLSGLVDPSLDDLIYPREGGEDAQARLTATEHCQPALLAIGVALTRVLEQVGVRPAQVAGHSVGEFTAAVAAGVLGAEDGVRWAAARGAAMAALTGDPGAMAALRCSVSEAEALLEDGAVIANVNHARQTVISGQTEAVGRVVERATAAGVSAVALDVSHGFHSPALAGLDLDDVVADLPLSDPLVPVISCIDDGAYRDAEHARQVFARHATSPVRFVRTLARLDADIFVQVAAGGPLQGFARGTGVPVVTLAGKDDRDGGGSLLLGLGRLWTLGVEVDVAAITDAAPVASVPPIVLPREVYWAVKGARTAPLSLSDAQTQVAASPTAAPVASESRASDDIEAVVMAAVARASAYPVASLRTDMTLTDDLGFDSMMLSELTTELSQAIEGMEGIPQELLINGPTIGQLIEAARTGGGAAEAVDDDAPLSRYAPVWRPAEAIEGTARTGEALWFVPDHSVRDLAGALIARVSDQAARGGHPDVLVGVSEGRDGVEALAAVVRCVAAEWPESVCKCVRFEGDVDEALLRAERESADTSVDVRYGPQGRQVAGLEPLAAAEAWDPAGQVVLITGGSRGIGVLLADALEAGGATVLRVGRAQADVRDADALRAWLADQPPVTAAVHAAGLLADGPLGSVSASDGQAARDVKAAGLSAVLEACGPTLKTVLALGSHAARFGNRHQAWYAAANAQMAEIAARASVRTVCVEMGPWTESAMVATIPEAMRKAMRARGADFVGNQAGIAALLEELAVGQGVVVRGRGLPSTLRAVRAEVSLEPGEPWLADHAFDGRPVLPLAGAAGLLASTLGAEPFALEDLTLFRGVAVPEPVQVRVVRQADRLELWHDGVACYRARVGSPDVGGVSPRAGGDAPSLALDVFYAEHTFHGPAMQGIVAIDGVGEDFVRGRVRVGARRPIDTVALDSAMQLTAYVAFTRFGRAGTPVGIRRYVQVRPWPVADTVVEAQATFGAGQGDRFEADLAFFDGDGALIAQAEGVAAQLARVEDETESVSADSTLEPEEPANLEQWTDPEQWPEVRAMVERRAEVARMGIDNPYFDLHQGTARDTTLIDGREVVNFSSYNYIGLSGDERIRDDVARAMAQYGTSVSASRVASGERPFHLELEAELADAHYAEDALVFPSGHATNVTVIGHLFSEKDLILHDELIHDSCLQGIRLSGAARRGFRHDDPDHLEAQLRSLRKHYQKVLILIEGVYSMDGDVARLEDYLRLKDQYGCLLMVDEAHSFGTIGATGRGIQEHFGVDAGRVDILMGTMSKSLSSMGGWIAGRRALTQYLRYTTPGFVFAAGITPTVGQAALSALKLMRQEPQRVTRLQHNARFFYEKLIALGLDVGPSRGQSPVVPVVTGASVQALLLAQNLLKLGINAKPIVYPAVAEDASRLRFFLTSLHTEEQLAWTARTVCDTLAAIRAELS